MKSVNNKRKMSKTTVSTRGQSTNRKEDGGVILAAGGLVWRESPRGKELAVIHRVRYDDWTLPKGKLVEGESWENAALREVKEETGCKVKLGNFAGCVSYTVKGAPKVVLFWNMTAEGECDFKQSEEVDQLLWLPVQEALHKLDYPGERNLITDTNRFLSKTPSPRLQFKKLFWSAEHRRLAETIGPYRSEMEHFIRFKMEQEKMGKVPLWASAVLNLLNKAQDALNKSDIELGWQYFSSAQLMSIYGLKGAQLRIRAQAILNEAEEKLGSWRKKTVKDALEEEAELKSNLSHDEVNFASRILQEHFTNLYRKLRIFKRQLYILQIVAFSAAIIWLSLLMPYLNGQAALNNYTLLFSVALFGIMGAAISGMLSIAGGSAEARIPEQLLTEMVTLARPVIGAVASLAVFAFLVSGLLQVGEIMSGLVLAISFAAGFSERLVMRAVETVI